MIVIHKILLITLLLSLFGTALQAQGMDGSFRLGLKAGIRGNRFYDDAQADALKSRTGFVGGGFAKIKLTRHFSLRPEVLFATRGGEYNYANAGQTEIQLSYLEVPLSLELRLLGFLNLHGGAHVGFLAGQDGKFRDANGNTLDTKLNREDLNEFDYGWHLGGGLDIGNIGIHVRFLRGLEEVRNSGSVNQFTGKLKNSAWELALSYAIK